MTTSVYGLHTESLLTYKTHENSTGSHWITLDRTGSHWIALDSLTGFTVTLVLFYSTSFV